MTGLLPRRALVLFGSAALLVGALAAPAAAAPKCTDEAIAERFTDPVVKGMVVCAANPAGKNIVEVLDGGMFVGGEYGDIVETMHGGTFLGAAGDDFVVVMYDGVFRGGEGRDMIHGEMFDGTFFGEAGDDGANTLHGGSYKGGAGNDDVWLQRGGVFHGGTGYDQAGFEGCVGADAVQRKVEYVTTNICPPLQ